MFGWAGKVTKRIMQRLGIDGRPSQDHLGEDKAQIKTNTLDTGIEMAAPEKARLGFLSTANEYNFANFDVNIQDGIIKEQVINKKLPLFNKDVGTNRMLLDMLLVDGIKKADLSEVNVGNNKINVGELKSNIKELFVEKIEKKIKHYYLKEDIKPGKIRALTPGKLKTKIKKDNRLVRLVPIRRHKENIRHIAREELKEIWHEVAKQIKDNMQKYELIAIFDKIPVNYVENIKMEDNWESIRFTLKDDFKEGPRMSKLIIIRHTETKKLSKVIVTCKEGN